MVKNSIIIPIYNAERYLRDCIDSILNQKFQEFELILVNDGSTDNSGFICDEYAQMNSKVKVFHLENGGVSKARNFGIEHAQGEYIQFVDADDCITEDCGVCFLESANKSNPDMIIGNSRIYDTNNNVLEILDIGNSGEYTPKQLLDGITFSLKAQYLHYVWNKWYRADIIRKYNIKFDTSVNLGEDFLFNCRFMRYCNSIALTQKEIYNYYWRINQSLTKKFRYNELERRRIMDGAFIELYQHLGLIESQSVFLRSAIGFITLSSLESVGYKDCKLSFLQKINFLNSFFKSEYYDYLLSLSLKDRHSLWVKAELLLAKQKCAIGLLLVFVLKNIYLNSKHLLQRLQKI